MTESSLEETAEKIFGTEDPAAVAHWVDYWNRGHERNLDLLRSFEEVYLLDLGKRRVLDAGCGVGSMGEVLRERCGHYVGVDVNRHVLRFSTPVAKRSYVQASGLSLPFAERSFDCIFAFDVLEHLPGGLPDQVRFLTELRRVLKPMGTILFTTPNFWFPYDAHSRSYFAHYLPVRMADWIHRRRHPAFLKEHGSTAHIPLLTPRRLRKGIDAGGLALLHDLPCCLDRDQLSQLSPLKSIPAYLGLGWYPHAEFWGILCRPDARSGLRLKLKTRLVRLDGDSSRVVWQDFEPRIDFTRKSFSHQLDRGWYAHEPGPPGYRWIAQESVCYLQLEGPVSRLRIRGFSPQGNRIRFWVDEICVGEHSVNPNSSFDLTFFLPFKPPEDRMVKVLLNCDRTYRLELSGDRRELGTIVSSIELLP